MLKTSYIVFIVWFTMENLCAYAQTNGQTRIPSGPRQCNTAQFMCSNRACIPITYRCDGDNDCADRSDEENCRDGPTQITSGPHQCNTAEFMCSNRACIPLAWRCDGDSDCADRSDEENCSGSLTTVSQSIYNVSCELHQFRCTTSNICIPMFWTCDGDVDCGDGSDEVECDTPTSSASTILTTTSFPTTRSSSSASTWQHSTKSNLTPPFEMTTKLNGAHALMTEEDTSGSEQGTSASHVQTEKEDKEYGYLDRINTMVAVIVGGVVITVTVISVAVVLVLVLKKRRTAKSEEHYDMPNFNQSCNANNDNGNVRTSNLYDFIPDPGDCSASNYYTDLEYTAAKENDYLTPVMESKEAPNVTIPQ